METLLRPRPGESEGAMARLIRERDWAATPLGALGGWPLPLRTLLGVMLGSNQPMFVAWGPERTLIYNDAYAEILAAKHPEALGRPFLDVWHEIRDDLVPIVEAAYGGEPVQMDDITLIMERKGYPEETHFAFSYTPVRDGGGAIAGFFCACQEITGQVMAERRLRESEARLRGVLDGMEEAFGLMDHEFRILTFNQAALALEPRPLEEIVGRTHWEVYPGSEHSDIGRLYKRAVAERVPVSLEHRYTWEDGTARWLDMRAYPIDGKLAVFWRDITERKEAEARLRESERRARDEAERVRLALDAGAIIGTWVWHLPTDRFTVDEAFARSFGLDPDLGREGLSLAQVVETVHPDDLPGLQAAIAEAVARGGAYAHQYRVRRADGRYYWIEANGRVDHGPDGTPLRFPGVLLDVEERRAAVAERDRATRLLEVFAEAVPGVVYAKDREGRMLIANRGTSDLIGKPPAEYLGRTDAEFLDDPEQARVVMENDARVMESGAPEQLEEEVSLPDGTRAVWFSTKAPLRDAGGKVVGLIGSSIDITARKRAEAALAESEASLRETSRRLNAILDNTREAVFLMDRSYRCVYANAAAEALTGYRFEELRGRSVHAMVHHSRPDGSPYPVEECPIGRASFDGARVSGEEMFVARDGSFYPVAFTASPVLDEAGEAVGTVLEARNIAEEKARDAALRESEERFRFALDAAGGIGTWDWDIPGNRVHTSERFALMYGLDPGRAQEGLPLAEYVAGIHPEDQAEVERLIEEAVAAGGDYRSEYRIQTRDGQTRWVIARGRCLRDADGRPVRFPGVTFDITDRKEVEARARDSEARLRAVLDAAPVGLVFADATGRITGGNARVEEILGHPVLSSRGVEEYGEWSSYHPDGRRVDGPEYPMARALSGEEQPEMEAVYQRGDGRRIWVKFIASPVRDGTGAVAGGVVATVDIDRERRAEADLRALNETLESRIAEAIAEREQMEEALRQSQKMEAVGQLTGGIAHDFNNMLAAVVGSLDLLGRRIGEEDARARRYVDAAMEGAKRAANLTQRLLAFSRQQPLKPEPVDMNRLVSGMSDLLQRSLGAGVRIETVLAGGLWKAHADPHQLENVILNLAVNARDAMPEGGRLTIETANAYLDSHYASDHMGVPPGQYVQVAVSDTGGGMTPEVAARAFDPFFTTKPVGQGTGLGLSQVYGFVKQSGGHVKIYSEPGQGTTVKIYLPRLLGMPEEAPAEEPPRELPRGEAQEVVLVVEDEPVVRQFTVDALTDLGYRVIEADGALAALRLLDAHPEVAVLFTDIVMPDTNGRKLADEALRRRPGLRVLFTTGYTRNAVVHNGVLDPGVHLLGKPFTVEQLAAKLREVLEEPAPKG